MDEDTPATITLVCPSGRVKVVRRDTPTEEVLDEMYSLLRDEGQPHEACKLEISVPRGGPGAGWDDLKTSSWSVFPPNQENGRLVDSDLFRRATLCDAGSRTAADTMTAAEGAGGGASDGDTSEPSAALVCRWSGRSLFFIKRHGLGSVYIDEAEQIHTLDPSLTDALAACLGKPLDLSIASALGGSVAPVGLCRLVRPPEASGGTHVIMRQLKGAALRLPAGPDTLSRDLFAAVSAVVRMDPEAFRFIHNGRQIDPTGQQTLSELGFVWGENREPDVHMILRLRGGGAALFRLLRCPAAAQRLVRLVDSAPRGGRGMSRGSGSSRGSLRVSLTLRFEYNAEDKRQGWWPHNQESFAAWAGAVRGQARSSAGGSASGGRGQPLFALRAELLPRLAWDRASCAAGGAPLVWHAPQLVTAVLCLRRRGLPRELVARVAARFALAPEQWLRGKPVPGTVVLPLVLSSESNGQQGRWAESISAGFETQPGALPPSGRIRIFATATQAFLGVRRRPDQEVVTWIVNFGREGEEARQETFREGVGLHPLA